MIEEPGLSEMPDRVWHRVMNPDQKSLEESRQWWSKKYGRELTLADAAEIHQNLFGLFKILFEEGTRKRKIAGDQRVVG